MSVWLAVQIFIYLFTFVIVAYPAELYLTDVISRSAGKWIERALMRLAGMLLAAVVAGGVALFFPAVAALPS